MSGSTVLHLFSPFHSPSVSAPLSLWLFSPKNKMPFTNLRKIMISFFLFSPPSAGDDIRKKLINVNSW